MLRFNAGELCWILNLESFAGFLLWESMLGFDPGEL